MTTITRRIGLSLGADICWPICYEELVKRLDLDLPMAGDRMRFEVDRLTIEPFDLRQPCRYDVVIDRLTHWYFMSREWIKKAVIMDDLYVFNNPWAVQSMTKQTTYCAMIRLGMPIPETWMIPPKGYEPADDLEMTLSRYAKLFDLAAVGKTIGYPLFMKPYDGGAWVGVNRIDDEASLQRAYDASGTRIMQLQQAVDPFDIFVRGIGLGPQVRFIRYEPSLPHHARYTPDRGILAPHEASLLRDTTLTINSFFGWDFNSCESLRKQGVFYPIDFANPCPDSQVTSLHYHFPWVVKANVRWSLFCAAVKKKMSRTLDWEPFFEVAAGGGTYREKLAAYAAIANARFETDRFEEFCHAHLRHLDEIAHEFFGTQAARDAVFQKVKRLFPEHEVESFTDHFWTAIQAWRDTEGSRPEPVLGEGVSAPSASRSAGAPKPAQAALPTKAAEAAVSTKPGSSPVLGSIPESDASPAKRRPQRKAGKR